VDHDRLFKELLTTFFAEFIELFFPELAAYMDRGRIEFLDKEVFTDITSGERHEVDVIAKTRFRNGGEAFFLVHVETQARSESAFPARMFRYFARLHERHGLPVYPIVLFSHEAPTKEEPSAYAVDFPDLAVLRFNYRVVQLNRLNWRDFVRQPNPVASALMAKMRIAVEDRPKVKLECLRLLATLKLTPAKMKLIGGFVERYLELSSADERRFEQELETFGPPEKEHVMEVLAVWEGRGIVKGMRGTIVRLLRRKFGEVPTPIVERVMMLSEDALGTMTDAVLDFSSVGDVEAWLAKYAHEEEQA
jgi:hypothetical protein